MKLTIESTDKTTDLDGVEARVWEGVSETGVKCFVFVHRIAVHVGADPGEFETELMQKIPPGRFFPLAAIL